MKSLISYFTPILLVALFAGCGKKLPALGEVSGAVIQNGKKLEGVRVEFMPDPEKGNMAEMSFAETDAEGKFTLSFSGKDETPGAAVGQHRVVLWDFAAMNTRDSEAIAPRFGDKFNKPASTPILVEVKAGQQTIDIDLDKY